MMDEFEALALAAAAKKKRDTVQPVQPSTGQRVKEFFLGDNDDTTQNLGEKIGTALNKAGESLTFGVVGDEASAAAAAAIPGGRDYNERLAFERQQEALLEQTNPGAALAADIGGAVVGAALPIGAIGTLGRGAGLMSRIGASAATGAGMGATAGFMEGEGASDRTSQAGVGAALGAGVGAVAPAIGAGVQKFADSRAANRAIREAARGAPTTEQQKAIARALYGQVDDAGVQIKPEVFSRMRQGLEADLVENGLDNLPGAGSLTPKASRVMEIGRQMEGRMAQEPTAALPFSSLDQLRQHAGTAASDLSFMGRPTQDARLGTKVIEGLDDFVGKLGPDDIAAGDVAALKTALPKAREAWSKSIKSGMIDDAIEQEGNYLSGGASAIRNRIASILRNPKLSRKFNEAEIAAMRRVVQGPMHQQILNYMGSGLGMMGQIGLGAVGGPVGAAIGIGAAAGSRKLSEHTTRKAAELARALVANGQLSKFPVASDANRRIAEQLLRRSSTVGLQQ